MAITVESRPEKTLSNNYLSKWNSSELPLRYKFESDLYPINKVNLPYTIGVISLDVPTQGTRIPLSSNPYQVNDFVTINGTQLPELNGNSYRVKLVDGNDIIIDYRKTGGSSNGGTAIKYYRNYIGLVKVYVGAVEGHPYNVDGSKPLKEIGTIEVDFKEESGDNIGYANIKSFVKPDITADFDYNYDNSHFGWTAFHIETAESYDVVEDGEIVSYTTEFTPDDQQNCSPFTGFSNDSFDNGLTDWLQEDVGQGSSDWLAGVGYVDNNGTGGTKALYQDLTVYNSVNYVFNVDFDLVLNTTQTNVTVLIYGKKLGGSWVNIFASNSYNSNGSYSLPININPIEDYQSIGVVFRAFRGGGLTPNVDVKLNDFNATSEANNPCLIFNYAVYGCKQFQDDLGGNFGDYVLNINNTITPKLLTHFDELSFFYGKPFYLNGIIPTSTFNESQGGDNLYISITLFNDLNEVVLSYNYKVDNYGDGVYTVNPNLTQEIDNNSISECGWKYGEVQFIVIPENTFLDADNGTFENDINGLTQLPYTPSTPNQVCSGLVRDTSIAPPRTGLASGRIGTNAPSMNEFNKEYSIFDNDTPIPVLQGKEYIITSYFLFTTDHEPNQLNNASFYFVPSGFSINNLNISPAELIVDNYNKYVVSTTRFVPLSNTTVTLTLYTKLNEDINNSTGLNFNIDDISVRGPINYISETKAIKNQCSCSPYGVTLRWKNDLGGWENWYFDKKSVYSENVTSKINIKRDITSNWDDTFINGDTQSDTIKTTSNKSILVRSQLLTKNEMEVLQQLRRSVRVQLLMDSGKWQTVTINQGRFVINDEGDKTRDISFEINLPDTVIQEQ